MHSIEDGHVPFHGTFECSVDRYTVPLSVEEQRSWVTVLRLSSGGEYC